MEEVKVVNKNKTIRNYSLDILKILAICFVCSYHFSLNNVGFAHIDSFTFSSFINTLFFMINTMCIPLFFMVNGALLLNKPVNLKKHIKKSMVLILAFLIWRIITIFSIGLANGLDFSTVGLKNFINGIFLFGSFPGVDLAHFWFIPMLLSLYIMYPLFSYLFFNNEKQINKYVYVILVLLLAFMIIGGDFVLIQKCLFKKVYTNFSGIMNFNPFGLARSGYIFYFLLGGIIFKYKNSFKNIKWYIILSVFSFSLMWLFAYWHFQDVFWDYIFGGYNLLPTVLMTTSLFLLCLKIPNEKIDKYKFLSCPIKAVGGNTLTIYYTHWIIGYTFLQTVVPYITKYGLFTNAIKAICFVVIGTLFGVVLKKIPIVKNLVS